MNVFLWNARARNGQVEATLNHPFPAQVELRRSFVDGRSEFHFPSRLRKARHRASALIVGVVIAAIAAAIVAIFVVRAVLNEAVPSVPLVDVPLGSVVAPTINVIWPCPRIQIYVKLIACPTQCRPR